MARDADYELVPVTPIRKLEKEIELLKGRVAGGGSDLTGQVIDVLKLNQKIVDELAMRQSELIAKLNETNSKLSLLTDNVAALTAVLSTAAEEEVNPMDYAPGGPMGPGSNAPKEAAPANPEMTDKLEKITEQNAALLNSLNLLSKELGKISEK